MLVHRRHGDLEQFGNERLRQPDGFVFKPALDARAAVFGLVKNDFGIGQGFVAHGLVSFPVERGELRPPLAKLIRPSIVARFPGARQRMWVTSSQVPP
jgi:hypothetical protein